MAIYEQRSHDASFEARSILIVSASGQFNEIFRKHMNGKALLDFRKNAALARRCLLERSYDLVVINAPLPGETGDQLAIDTAEGTSASVLLVIPAEVYEDALQHVTDHGIFVIAKPLAAGRLEQTLRYLLGVRKRVHRLERQLQAARDRAEEIRLIDKAKMLLIEKHHMTEDEAHRYIGKEAMDHGLTRRLIAERLLEDDE